MTITSRNRNRLPKFVNEFRDRQGHVRRYFRRPGQRVIPLPADCSVQSPKFMQAYLAAFAQTGETETEEAEPSDKIGEVIGAYYRSSEFQRLAENTKRNRRSVLERFRNNHGAVPITAPTQLHIEAILEKLSPAVRRSYRQALQALMAYAIRKGLRKDDPTAGIHHVLVKSDKIHSWTEIEIAQYKARHPAGTKPHLAWALLFHTAQRLSDVIKLGPKHVIDGMIHIEKQQKTGAEVWIEVHPELAEALAAIRVIGTKTFLVSDHGTQFDDGSFGNAFRRWCNEAGLRQCSAHGLRHAGLTWFAENGATAPEIQARGGHKTLAQAQHYIELANKKKLARSGGAKVASKRAGD